MNARNPHYAHTNSMTEHMKDVRGVTSPEYDGVGTNALRAWPRYWEGVAAGTVKRNARDEGLDAPDEAAAAAAASRDRRPSRVRRY